MTEGCVVSFYSKPLKESGTFLTDTGKSSCVRYSHSQAFWKHYQATASTCPRKLTIEEFQNESDFEAIFGDDLRSLRRGLRLVAILRLTLRFRSWLQRFCRDIHL